REPPALLESDVDLLGDIALLLDALDFRPDTLAVDRRTRPCSDRDMKAGLIRADQKVNPLVSGVAARQRLEVEVREWLVERRAVNSPDQFSAVIESSSPARCMSSMDTKRRSSSTLRRPAGSSKRIRRSKRPRRRSSS